jgi:hypothetical protein
MATERQSPRNGSALRDCKPSTDDSSPLRRHSIPLRLPIGTHPIHARRSRCARRSRASTAHTALAPAPARPAGPHILTRRLHAPPTSQHFAPAVHPSWSPSLVLSRAWNSTPTPCHTIGPPARPANLARPHPSFRPASLGSNTGSPARPTTLARPHPSFRPASLSSTSGSPARPASLALSHPQSFRPASLGQLLAPWPGQQPSLSLIPRPFGLLRSAQTRAPQPGPQSSFGSTHPFSLLRSAQQLALLPGQHPSHGLTRPFGLLRSAQT